MTSSELQLQVNEVGPVSALLIHPPDAWSLYVLAHGAGAGMRHWFMESIAVALGSHGIATLRYHFPYMEAGRKYPDNPRVLEATVQAAFLKAREVEPGLPLIAGGKSLGGRMTSGAAANGLLVGVKGLVFLGFPLHPPGQPGTTRGDHLSQVEVPLLFLQGTRDAFARLDLLEQVIGRLPEATLHLVEDGDHSFQVPKRSGRSKDEVLEELCSTIERWARAQVRSKVSA